MPIEHIQLAPGGPFISQLVAGVMTWGEWGTDLSTHQMAEMIATCIDEGLTTFDHADIYGHYSTEKAFGDALAELGAATRDRIQLVSKCGIRLTTHRKPENKIKGYDTSKAYIIGQAETSLRNLRTDYLDVFLIHRPSPLLNPVEVADAFETLRKDGKVRHFGVSNFTPSQFDLLRQYVPLVTNQVECNPLRPELLFDGTFDQLLAAGIRPMIWSPLGGSKYFAGEGTAVLRLRTAVQNIAENYGTSETVILIAWLLRHPAGPVPVLGTTKPERLREAKQALSLQLDRQDWFAILEAARGEEVD